MKLIKSLVLKCRYIWLGIKSIGKLNLGDKVVYNGRVCSLYQGSADPYWHLHDMETKECFQYVHRDEFKKQHSLRNALADIKSMYKFYMGYWHGIFMRCIPLSRCFVVDYRNWKKYDTE